MKYWMIIRELLRQTKSQGLRVVFEDGKGIEDTTGTIEKGRAIIIGTRKLQGKRDIIKITGALAHEVGHWFVLPRICMDNYSTYFPNKETLIIECKASAWAFRQLRPKLDTILFKDVHHYLTDCYGTYRKNWDGKR